MTGAPRAGVVLLVRHAIAVARDDWDDDNDDARPLTRRGVAQADALVPALARFPVHRVLSSPSLRCTDTVRPLALARGVALETTDALAEGNGKLACELVDGLAGEAAVLCSHGDVIPEILLHLERDHGLDLGPDPRCRKGSTWVLHPQGGRFVRAGYVDPPA